VAVAEVAVAEGDRIFAFSDGLGDRTTPEELRTRYLAELAQGSHLEHCAAIRHRVASLAAGEGAGDDLTWALWEVPSPSSVQGHGQAAPTPPPGKLVTAFEAEFRLDPRVHGIRDVLPRVLTLLMGFPVEHGQAQIFSMLLHEALTNAVEHGLLGLPSALKAEGFEAYEQHRQRALARPGKGEVRFRVALLHVEGDPDGRIRQLRAEVEDPGPGFDWRPWLQPGDPNLAPFGRGIELMRGLGQDLTFNDAGNRVAFAIDCT
jgi:anti-sigma regulatory factor (Ser/Thr protein kinase)